MPPSKSPSSSSSSGASVATAAAHPAALFHHCRNFGGLLLGLALGLVISSRASTNGLALTPPMGWNSWNYFACNVSDSIIRSMADAMATNGMKAAGYQFINMDDCWQVSRDENGVHCARSGAVSLRHRGAGRLRPFQGIESWASIPITDWRPAQGRPGGYGYEYLDAQTYALVGRGLSQIRQLQSAVGRRPPGRLHPHGRRADGQRTAHYLQPLRTGRSSPGSPPAGNLWRTTGDINDSLRACCPI